MPRSRKSPRFDLLVLSVCLRQVSYIPLLQHLESQQKGVDFLLQLIEKDMEFVRVMEAGYGLPPVQHAYQAPT